MSATLGSAPDPHFKKIVAFRPFDRVLQLQVSQSLFSSFDVDVGTRSLLRTLEGLPRGRFRTVLDLGSGYGPLGLAVKSRETEAVVHMVDRDALAVDYSRRNAELNGMTGVETYGSLGYDDVIERNFDLIVSNIPAKAGESAIAGLVRDARHHLAPGGLAAIVVVVTLEAFVTEVLASTPELTVVAHRKRPGHAVFHYRPVTGDAGLLTAFDRGDYDRSSIDLTIAGHTASLVTVHGIPEFESPSHGTELLLDALESLKDLRAARILVVGPGQGYIPIALAKWSQDSVLTLIDRDLLALRTSERNLVRNDVDPERLHLLHEVGIPIRADPPVDLIALVLRDDDEREAILEMLDRAAAWLKTRGTLVVTGRSTAISRLLQDVRRSRAYVLESRRRHRGAGLVVLSAKTGPGSRAL